MAAHAYTMLKQISEGLESPDYDISTVAHAMLYAKTADTMVESLDMYDLAKENDREGLKKLVTAMLPKYKAIWELLGQPKNYEDWISETFYKNGGLKTRRKGQYNKLIQMNIGWISDFRTPKEKR